jgi:hypothetical protein
VIRPYEDADAADPPAVSRSWRGAGPRPRDPVLRNLLWFLGGFFLVGAVAAIAQWVYVEYFWAGYLVGAVRVP